MNGWFIFFGLLWAHIILLFWLVRSGRMQKWNLSVMLGLVLMIRTQKGKGLLEKISKPKRFWNAFGDFGTVLSLVGMLLMTLLMLLLLPVVLNRGSGFEPLKASEILVIPGVNPFVPLWYGIAALIITLVVHEGGHGVLARANNLKVKSLGLLWAVVPIGAFVEPDEDELNEAPRRHRLRVFAAGATVNIVLATILMFVFAGMVGAAEPIEGIPVFSVTEGSGAHAADLAPGSVITAIDNLPTLTTDSFTSALENRQPGDVVNLTFHDQPAKSVTLGDRWTGGLDDEGRALILQITHSNGTHAGPAGAVAYCDTLVGNYTDGGDCAEQLEKMAFMGIQHIDLHNLQASLSDPISKPSNILRYMSMPIGEVRGQPVLGFYLPTFFVEPFEGYWIVATLVFWVFWINLMVGLTNILPMLPLDGGHIFRDAMQGLLIKWRPNMEREARDRRVGTIAKTMSFIILGAFLLQIFGPYLVQAF